jgi:YcxB-like protein
VRITYELTADEFIAAQSLHSRRNLLGYINLAICYLIGPLLGIFFMLSVFSFPKVGFNLSSLSQELFPLLITLSPLWLHLYWRYRFKSSRVSNSPCVIDFGDDRIVTEMPGFSKSTVEWVAIKKYRESKKMLLIYLSGVSFFAIPRRVCEKGEYVELIELLKRKLSSGKCA